MSRRNAAFASLDVGGLFGDAVRGAEISVPHTLLVFVISKCNTDQMAYCLIDCSSHDSK